MDSHVRRMSGYVGALLHILLSSLSFIFSTAIGWLQLDACSGANTPTGKDKEYGARVDSSKAGRQVMANSCPSRAIISIDFPLVLGMEYSLQQHGG